MTTAAPTYSSSNAPIDTARLTATRFIDQDARKYPFRDALGRINLHLVNASLAEAEADNAPPATCDRLRAWQRHAVRAINSRPKDERATLDELFGDEENNIMLDPRHPQTVNVNIERRRRLFRAPKEEDEPLFDSEAAPHALSADRLYLCRMKDEGAEKAERDELRKATRGDR